jgi:hypothetical protein
MALSLGFHMVFAALGIGMPLLMVIAEGLDLRTGRVHYRDLARKWARATGLLFAIGAVSGTALSFELGLLWPHFMEYAGATVGPASALEGFSHEEQLSRSDAVLGTPSYTAPEQIWGKSRLFALGRGASLQTRAFFR